MHTSFVRTTMLPLFALTVAILAGCGGGVAADCMPLCSNSRPKFEIVEDIASADLNGDGRSDVAMASDHDDSVAVLMNSAGSPGSLAVSQTFNVPSANRVFAADLHGDGRIDLVIAGGPNGTIQTALQDAGTPGHFAAPAMLLPGVDACALGDLNGDGQPDLVVANLLEFKILVLVPHAASPAVASTLTLRSLTNGLSAAAVADVDRDGRNDVLLVDSTTHATVVWQQDPAAAGTFLPPAAYALPSGADGLNMAVADLDRDGRRDVVIGGSSAIAVFLQDAAHAGVFKPAVTYPVSFADAVAVADVNEDGHPDIATNSGVSTPIVNGVMTVVPGVLYQDPAHPGTFLGLQDLK
jgi:hypothetical protein